MKQDTLSYYLYCMNIQCESSIYHSNVDIMMRLTAENLVAIQICPCCNKPLISAIDLEINQVVAQVNSKKMRKPNYLNN